MSHAHRNSGRRKAGPGPGPGRARGPLLAELSRDVGYLAFKEKLGEPLSSDERALLDAARSSPDPKRVGGGS